MRRSSTRSTARTLRVVFLAALLPLVLVLGLQYWWLKKLEETSVLAGRAALNNFLEAVSTEILYFYGPSAERALDVPSSLLARERLDSLASHYRRKSIDGARLLFVVRFEPGGGATTLFFDPVRGTLEPPAPSAESRAVTVACAPWLLMRQNGIAVDSAHLVVEERDPENRIILNPVLGPDSRVVGVAGLILDVDYFGKRLLPRTIQSIFPKFFAGSLQDSVVVSVRDRGETVRFSTIPDGSGRPDEFTRYFSFVFTDWRLGVHSRGKTPEQWARASFFFNVTLSALAGALLLVGLALALKTASREMKLSRMKSDFVSNVSHELRTPLSSIRVFGEFLALGRATTPEKVKEYGEYIEAESRRLTLLINNILDLAKIEAGQKAYRFIEGSVEEVLSDTLSTFLVRVKHAGFEIDYRRPAEPLPPARIDPDALGQAFHNLLDNAMNYSGDSRWVGVTIERIGGEIRASVEDRGIGVPEEEQKRVFERFHRVGTGLVHDVRGTGLGLALVRHIVSAHGGRVTLDSEPGRGSRFSIYLPIAAPAPPPRGEKSAEMGGLRASAGPKETVG